MFNEFGILLPDELSDQSNLMRGVSRLSKVPFGKTFSSIVSPMLGGSDFAANPDIVAPGINLGMALAIFKALRA